MKKLIILGAGAHTDFGFPTSTKLSQSIHSVWDRPGDKYTTLFLNSINKHGKKFTDFIESAEAAAAARIKRLSDNFFYSAAESIDDFLSQPHENFEVSFGKMTILNLILEKERDSINTDNHDNLFKWESNWLRIFFGKEFRYENIEILYEKLTKNPLKFISFNYDRSLEYFLFNAIKNYYGLSNTDAISVYKKIEFFHIYGKLAPLEWESDDPNGRLKFGDDFKDFPYNKTEKLYNFASNIKVINEDRNNFETIKQKCLGWIRESDRVYILGFGFLDSNYKLLGIEDYKQSCAHQWLPSGKFHYTSYGLSVSKSEDVIKKFGANSMGDCRAKAHNFNAHDYMLHHYR